MPTRWNSVLYMLQSIEKSYDECTNLLVGNREIYRISNINAYLLRDVINLLDPFEKATRQLSKDKEPTICFVYPWYQKLKNHLNSFNCETDENTQVIDECIELLINGMDQKYQIKDIHKTATIFDPRLKSLKNLFNEEERKRLYNMAIRDVEITLGTDVKKLTDLEIDVEEPLPKKQKTNELEEFFDCTPTTSKGRTQINMPIKDEFNSYINSTSVNADTEPLSFWKIHQKIYPNLSKYAKYILCIPATSTSSERIFSITGKTLDKRRSTLSPSKVDKLLFLHYNQQL